MKKLYIGIDQSISHTSVNVLDEDGKTILNESYNISNDFLKFYKDSNKLFDFRKTQAYKTNLIDDNLKRTKKLKDYTKQEKSLLKVSKQKRVSYITIKFNELINKYKDDYEIIVGFENISYGSVGAIADLGILLGSLTSICTINNIKKILVEPTKVKKFATTKGNADKDQMEDAICNEDKELLKSYCPKNSKEVLIGFDNLADSYWISHYIREVKK